MDVFAEVRESAENMAHVDARSLWQSVCCRVLAASRRAEQLLQPLLPMEISPEEVGPHAAESVAFTHLTAQSHNQASLEGSVTAATARQTLGEAEAADFSEENFGGGTEAQMQELKDKLLELQNERRYQDQPDIAVTLYRLGLLSSQDGDFKGAKQQLQECLRMTRYLNGDKDHEDIAAILHQLGVVSGQAGDLEQAKQQLEESLRMKRSLHAGRDHADIAATLHVLGLVSGQAGDLEKSKERQPAGGVLTKQGPLE